MRTALIAYTGAFSIILMVAIISTITMKSSYSELISQSLDDSIEYSIKMLQTDRSSVRDENKYYDTDIITWNGNVDDNDDKNEKFKKAFITYLASNIDARVNNLDVRIYGADVDSGVLSVEVTAYFSYPTGSTDKVVSYKTVILDKESQRLTKLKLRSL